MDEPIPAPNWVEAWRPAVPGIDEVFHARIVDYGYPTHCHDTWTVLLVDDGAIRYDLDRRECDAWGQTVAILPPGVAHNGEPAPGSGGFAKRVLYLDGNFLPDELVGAAVDRSTLNDPHVRRSLVELHRELRAGVDPLMAESALTMLAERIALRLRQASSPVAAPEPRAARQLRQLLDASIDGQGVESISLAGAALRLGRSKPHLVRSFRSAYGVSPHAYLLGRRVDAARRLLLDGVPAAEVAHAVGFYDQSHLTRHFKRHTSVTPAAFAASCKSM